jgi:SAM-dependent methyltransferase
MTQSTVYDEVRYSSYPYALTHPDRLATVAALHGLSTPDPATARVLEIGCGAGGNLLAMAAATPGITALGIDLAHGPIEDARRLAEAAGITNAEFRQADLTDVTGGELGEFDFIVAHGVFTWIPEEARDALLAAAHAHLAADGLAIISHNCYPGCYTRQALREVGLWFSRGQETPLERAEHAQQLYRFLYEDRGGTSDWWGQLLENQGKAFAIGPLYRLVHDDMSDHWKPVWFSDFAERAARHRLAYVGDSDLAHLLPRWLPDFAQTRVHELAGGDRIAIEQITDMLRCTFFRHSVLCRDSRAPDGSLHPATLHELHFGPRGEEGAPLPDGLLGSALALLRSRAPDTVPFAELRAATGAEPDALAQALLDGFLAEQVMPHRAPLTAVDPTGVERPAASALARHQSTLGSQVTTRAYANVHMEEPAARVLLQLLDGTRDRAAIRAEFQERTGIPISAEDLERNLVQLGRLYLLSES